MRYALRRASKLDSRQLPGISAMLEKKLDRAQVAAVGSKMQRRLSKLINRVWIDMARQIFQNNAVVTVRGRGAQPELKQQESRALLEHSG